MADQEDRRSAYPYRINVRLSGDARERLDAYRKERGMNLSEAVRDLCKRAQVTRTIVGVANRGRSFGFEANEAVVPPQPRFRMRAGKRKGDGFVKFFMHPSDIGVRLDTGSWDRLSLFAQRRGFTISEAVRELCLRATPRFVGASVGRRVSARDDGWDD